MTGLALSTFLAGVGVGLAVAAPIGPMGMLCIQRTLAFGLWAGLATGLAAATVQAGYGLLAILGYGAAIGTWLGTWLGAWLDTGVALLPLGAAALLAWFAYRVLRREVVIVAGGEGPGEPLRSFRDALAVGLANPVTPVLFLAAFSALVSLDGAADAPALIGGVFTGATGWYLALSALVALLRSRLSARALTLTNRAAAGVLLTLAFAALASALGAMPR